MKLRDLGKEAINAHRNIEHKYGAKLPSPGRINVSFQHQGKYTVALVSAGNRSAAGVAARCPRDNNKTITGHMFALTRALKALGGVK